MTLHFEVLLVLAYLVHEMGHVLAMLALGVPFVGVELRWRGLCINRTLVGGWRDVVVTGAGVAMNAAVCLYALLHADPFFAACNLAMLVANLLPFPHSDGRRLLTYAKAVTL